MKFYNTRKSSSGQYWTTEFSENDMTNINVVALVIVSTLLALLSTIASGILVMVTVHDLEDEGIVPSIYGALISLIFLLDIHYQFIIRVILYVVVGDEWINALFNLNVGYFVTHIFLIFFGSLTYYNLTGENRKMKLFAISACICFVTFIISTIVYDYKPYDF